MAAKRPKSVTPKSRDDDMRELSRLISDRLSNRGRRKRQSSLEKNLKLLEDGGYNSPSGFYKLSGIKTLEIVCKVLQDGAGVREISPKVAQRFNWSEIDDVISDYCKLASVDEKLVRDVLTPRKPKARRS